LPPTQLRFRELGLFNYSNIVFREAPVDTNDSTEHSNKLNCTVELARKKLHAFSIEAEGTNKAGQLGVGGNFTYTNNNIFRGAEILRFKIFGSVEFQKDLVGNEETEPENNQVFNTIETGAEVSIDFPKFLIPIKQERFPKYFKP